MPKEAKEAQEVEKAESSQEVSETTQEATQSNAQTEQKAEQKSEKGFFAKALDKAKESTSELFSAESSQEAEQAKPAQATPKLKSILKKGVKFTSVTAFIYKGEGEFILKIGAYPYTIQSGEVFIVPNDKTAQYLRYKEQLFSEITE